MTRLTALELFGFVGNGLLVAVGSNITEFGLEAFLSVFNFTDFLLGFAGMDLLGPVGLLLGLRLELLFDVGHFFPDLELFSGRL